MSEVTALNCPNCGGSVDIPASHEDIIKCPYCGTTLQLPHQPEPEAQFEPEAGADAQARMQEALALARARAAAKPSRGPSVLGVILTFIILAAIAIGIAAAFIPIFGGGSLNLYDGVVVLPSDSSTPDLAAVVRQGDEDNIRLAVVDGKTRATHWVSSESFSTDDGHLPPIPGGSPIYFVDGSKLMAYGTATGKIAWQKTLAIGIASSCTDCVRLVDGKLMLLTKEGSLQAFDPATGEAAWSVALDSSPDEILLAGGKPAVVYLNSSKNNVFQIYDP